MIYDSVHVMLKKVYGPDGIHQLVLREVLWFVHIFGYFQNECEYTIHMLLTY